MADRRTWLIDFDDTLASGNLTWAIHYAFPKLIRDHQLSPEPTRLRNVMLRLQEQSSQGTALDVLLRELFFHMGWPTSLERPFMQDLTTRYRPTLFADTLPFLKRLRDRQQRVIIVSNNPHAIRYVDELGITPYIDNIYTPLSIANGLPKPHRSLWDHIVGQHEDIKPAMTTVVGDDPWSDGAFADGCALGCWLVDRNNWLEKAQGHGWQRVRSLDEISI